MDQAMTYFVPLFAFMLIPVWIPMIAIVVGNVIDRVRPVEHTAAESAVMEARQRAAATRGQAPARRAIQAQPLAA